MTLHEHDEDALCFIDGPLKLFIREATKEEILEAFKRLSRYILIAALQLDERHHGHNEER